MVALLATACGGGRGGDEISGAATPETISANESEILDAAGVTTTTFPPDPRDALGAGTGADPTATTSAPAAGAPTTAARPGSKGASPTTAKPSAGSPAGPNGSTATTTKPSPSPTTTKPSPSPTTAKPSPSPTTVKPTPTTAKPTPTTTAPPAGNGPQPTAAGTYVYDLEGSSSKQTLVVNPASGSTQTSRLSAPGAGTSEQTLRYDSDGIKLLRMKQSTPGGTYEFVAPAGTLAFPHPMSPGRTWSWNLTSTDGQVTLQMNLRAERRETVSTTAGEAVSTMVVTTSGTISGAASATTNGTAWVSEGYRLPIKQHQVVQGQYGSVPFRFETRGTLQSTQPS